MVILIENIQKTMVTFKVDAQELQFLFKTNHRCSTRSDIGLVSYFTVRHNYFVLEYISNNFFRQFTVGGQLMSNKKFKEN